MKTKTHIQFFSSNFDVLLEQNNPDLAVAFSSKTNLTYCVPAVPSVHITTAHFKMIWKLFENCQPRWELSWESVQWFMPTNSNLLSWPHDVMTTLEIVFIQDEWFMINLQILVDPHSPAQPCVLGTSLKLLEGGARPVQSYIGSHHILHCRHWLELSWAGYNQSKCFILQNKFKVAPTWPSFWNTLLCICSLVIVQSTFIEYVTLSH